MRQVTIAGSGGLSNLTLGEAPDAAAPGPGEIRVRIAASSLNYHDLRVAMTEGATAPGRIPLADGAGTVDAVGEGVTEFAAGDSVVSGFFPLWLSGDALPSSFATVPGDGVDGYARETVTMPATWFTHAPKGWSAAESATITTAGLTAWRALTVDGPLKAGETVLALGTGGVSIYALQIAKAMGARVIVTSSSDEKLERAKSLGADHVINYRETPEWGEAVLDATDGRGADHVIEVGGPGTLAQSIVGGKVGGHIALIGVLTGRSGDIPTGNLMRRQQRLQGLIVGAREHQQDFVRALDATGIRPVIGDTFDLADLKAAFLHQKAGAHFGKIAITI